MPYRESVFPLTPPPSPVATGRVIAFKNGYSTEFFYEKDAEVWMVPWWLRVRFSPFDIRSVGFESPSTWTARLYRFPDRKKGGYRYVEEYCHGDFISYKRRWIELTLHEASLWFAFTKMPNPPPDILSALNVDDDI